MFRESVRTLNLMLVLWLWNCQGQYVEQKLQTSIVFWTEGVCKVPTTKTVYFHGIFRESSHTLHNYFEALIQGIGDLCDVTVLSKMYRPPKNSTVNLTSQDYWDRTSNANATSPMYARSNEHVAFEQNRRRSGLLREILTENLLHKPIGAQKIARINYDDIVDMWNINIIFLDDNRFFEEILHTETPFTWTRQEHFIIFAVWNKAFLRRSKNTEQVIGNILRKLWQEYRIHNVFFNEPVTASTYRGYTFNPFRKVNDTAWGKVEVIETSSQFELFSTLAHLTRQRTRNFNGQSLKVSLFETDSLNRQREFELPTKSVRHHTVGYDGLDAIVMGTMAEHMNFKVEEVAPSRGGRFGHQMENGTYTGALADIADRSVDVCFVSFFVKRYGKNMDILEFSTYVDFDKVCAIVPKAHKIPKGLRIYHIFQPSVWCFVILSQLLLQLAWYYIQILSVRRKENVDFQWTMFKAFFINTGYSMKLPRSTAERILLLGVFVSSMTVMGTFNGLLYKSFAKDMYYKDINRLSELEATNLPVMVNSESMNDLFGSGDDPEEPVMGRLRNKMLYGHSSLRYTAYYRNASTLMREYTFPLMKEIFVDKDGTRLIHLVPECPGYYYLSYVLPRNSILFPRFVAIIGRLNQAGLTRLWKQRTLVHRARKMKINIEETEDEEDSDFIAFTLNDMQTCFTCLAMGLTMSAVAFFYEKGWLKRCFKNEIKVAVGNPPKI